MKPTKVKGTHILVKRTVQEQGKPDQVESFTLPFLNSRIIGEGVNNKTIYDLKKDGRAVVQMNTGKVIIFEIIGDQGLPRVPGVAPA